jgi:hypothetical protein
MPSSRSLTNAHRGSFITLISWLSSPLIYDIYLDRTTLSPTLTLALCPSSCHHLTTHWPHRRTATTNFEHFWRRAPPSGSRGNRFPAPQSASTATHLPGSLGRTFLLPSVSECSSRSTICHPGTKATAKVVAQRFVWPGMQKNCRAWARVCQACQRSKVSRHTVTPVRDFTLPAACLLHVHIDLV